MFDSEMKMFDSEMKMRVIIPIRNKEIINKQTTTSNTPVINMTINIPKKNINTNQLNKIIQSNYFKEIETDNILTDIIAIGNYINKASRSIDLKKYKNYSLNTYVSSIIDKEIDMIKKFSIEVEKKDKNNKTIRIMSTIEKQVKELADTYEYPLDTNNEISFYTYIYEVWEIIHLSKNAIWGMSRYPYLYSQFQNCDIKYGYDTKLKYFLNKYEALNKFRFHLIKKNQYENLFEIVLATEDMRLAAMFSILCELTIDTNKKGKFTMCSVPGCYNLFRKTRSDNKRCNTALCTAERVKQYGDND